MFQLLLSFCGEGKVLPEKLVVKVGLDGLHQNGYLSVLVMLSVAAKFVTVNS